jgi:conjugative relaxase-like TrwC/TraI family protein
VKADDFSHLLDGHDPSGEHVLVPHREGLSERRAGWDVTISPHKSVSLAALVGADSRLLEAHDRAVEKALSELERHAQAWVHGGRDVETTGLLVATSFRPAVAGDGATPRLWTFGTSAMRAAVPWRPYNV